LAVRVPTILLLATALAYAAPASGARLESMIGEYGRAYRNKSGSIESLYGLACAIGDSLRMSSPLSAFDLESMSVDAFNALQDQLPGMTLLRDGLVGASVDVPAFQFLARARGDSADVDFFATLFAIEDSSSWPNYVQRQTDDSGCMMFGTGRVVAAYAAWKRYLAQHPGRYRAWAKDGAGIVVTELTGAACACEDRASAVRELQLFLDRFPRGDDAEMVRARLKELRDGKGELQEHCHSG